MSSRYATIITDDDGREVVSAIGQFEGAPDMQRGHFEPVPAGVRIGMIRGGPVDVAGGFGFPSVGVSAGGVALIRARLKALPDVKAAKPDAASRPRKTKPTRAGKKAKPRKGPARKAAAKAKTAAKPEIAALAGTAE